MLIRFVEKEVYVIDKEEIDRKKLLMFFLKEREFDNVVVVKDEENPFLGTITYKDITECNIDSELKIHEEYLVYGEDIFEKAKQIFKENDSISYIPVFDRELNMQYFCFNDTRDYSGCLAINELSNMSEYLFIKDIFPKVQAFYLHEMNEMSYLFWKLLKKINFPVEIFGETWKIRGVNAM